MGVLFAWQWCRMLPDGRCVRFATGYGVGFVRLAVVLPCAGFVRLAGRAVSGPPLQATDKGAPVAAPPDPGLWPASPPLRGPFASSGFLTDRRDAPSLARARLFATSLSLVLKSPIRSAVLTASLPAVISSLTVWSFIAAGVRASRDFRTGLITGNHLFCMYPSFYICLFRALPGAGLAKRLSEAARQKHYERLGEASVALRNNRRPGCADRTSAKGRREPGMASPDGPSAAGRDEGTPQSGPRRQPDAGIVKGRASAP